LRPRAVFVAAVPDPRSRAAAFALAQDLRAAGVEADIDYQGRSLKAQMRGANKEGFGYVAIIGEEELAKEEVTLKDMSARSESRVRMAELPARLAAASVARNEVPLESRRL
jgi:histidyl-tRNA synthetase